MNLQELVYKARYRLAHKFRTREVYELRGDRIIRGKGELPEDVLEISDIDSWVDYGNPFIKIVPISLKSGPVIRWSDPFQELDPILRKVAGAKVVPRF